MAAPVTVDHTPFSATLRESTRGVHARAHQSPFMDALFGSRLPLPAYARLAAQYHFIYQALEEASDALADHPVGGAFVFDELRRGPALAGDLAFLVGDDWATRIEPLPATQDYVRRIRTVAFEWPGGYVAHHYTRYLGDLAGGQAVRKLLEQTYGITGPGALFYHFELDNVPAFRKRYRALLDEAPWDSAERQRILSETLVAFEFTIAMLADLAREVGA